MPLSQPLCYSAPYLGPAQVRGRADTAGYKFVQETVLEAGEELRGEAVPGQERV